MTHPHPLIKRMNEYERNELTQRAINKSWTTDWFTQLFCLHYYIDTGCTVTRVFSRQKHIHLCANCGKRKDFNEPQMLI